MGFSQNLWFAVAFCFVGGYYLYVNERSVTSCMTREAIIKAAFKVWGQELYQTMSLSDVARELGVSKAALYRHFEGKQALLDAMNSFFFDEHAAFIKKDYERALAAGNLKESSIIMIRAISEYYARNEDAFIFSLFRIFGSRQIGKMPVQMAARGVDLNTLFLTAIKSYHDPSLVPFIIHLVMVSVIFWLGQFHRHDRNSANRRSTDRRSVDQRSVDEEIRVFIAGMEERINRGFGFGAEEVDALDYSRLEEKAAQTLPHDTEDNRLLKAVAEVVAETGLSHASMEMVATRSGLAKSSLYSHFKNKQDMIDTLFLTEFTRIAAYVRECIRTSNVSEEQLYLGLSSIAAYLQSRPDILAVMDWLRTQRPNLKLRPRMISEKQRLLPEIYRIITDIDLPGEAGENKDRAAQWVLFLTVKSLVWRLETEGLETVAEEGGFGGLNTCSVGSSGVDPLPPDNIRTLYRFIARGLEGFNL